jgi:hypothetical protein
MTVGFYSFTPLNKECRGDMGIAKDDIESIFKPATKSPGEKLEKIRSILKECIERKAGIDEFAGLVESLLV